MAVIAQNLVKDAGIPVNVARSALSAADTFTYTQGSGQVLILYNTTAAIVNVTLAGTTPQTIVVPGYGGTISTAGGKVIAVPANGTTVVDLDDIYAYLQGATVNVTGGTGVTAHLYN